jgi:hypothetical protein
MIFNPAVMFGGASILSLLVLVVAMIAMGVGLVRAPSRTRSPSWI